MTPRRIALHALTAALIAIPSLPATAQEVTLRAVNGFQEGTYFARNFERFIQRVNAEGKGLVVFDPIAGGAA